MEFKDFIDTYRLGWKKYATFKGRANRSEFLVFMLANMAFVVIWYALLMVFHQNLMNSGAQATAFSMDFVSFWDIAGMIGMAALITPFMAVTARRFHDIGWSGWFCLLLPVIVAVLPFFTWPIAVLVLGYFKSKNGYNPYESNTNINAQ